MPLMKCPKCGKETNDKSMVCIHCGFPCVVSIKIPADIKQECTGILSTIQATIVDKNNSILWEGTHGENAAFTIDKPTEITVELGGEDNEVQFSVEPGEKYYLIKNNEF